MHSVDSPRYTTRLTQTTCAMVGIAASAGGIGALRQILGFLPASFPATLIIHLHFPPEAPSALATILQRHTLLPVTDARHGMSVCPGMVYVTPSGQYVEVTPAHTFCLTSWENRGYCRPQADGMFTSLAVSLGMRAIGVILTGYLSDGAQGARAIHAAGGLVLVQDPATAEAAGMPQAAIATGCVDVVRSLQGIAAALINLTMLSGAAVSSDSA
jgi:two-component system chemotaxis response regulator CheB